MGYLLSGTMYGVTRSAILDWQPADAGFWDGDGAHPRGSESEAESLSLTTRAYAVPSAAGARRYAAAGGARGVGLRSPSRFREGNHTSGGGA